MEIGPSKNRYKSSHETQIEAEGRAVEPSQKLSPKPWTRGSYEGARYRRTKRCVCVYCAVLETETGRWCSQALVLAVDGAACY